MHLLTEIVTGLVAGWLTGLALKGRGYGIFGSLLIGLAGGVVGGWVLHEMGVTGDRTGLTAQVLVSLVGGVVFVTAVRALDHAARQATRLTGQPLAAAVELEARINRLNDLEQRVLTQFLRRKPVATDTSVEFEERETFGQRVADHVAAFGGSWTFIGFFMVTMSLWMAVNLRAVQPFDPYPFILLNLVLSCLAAMQAPVIMMSQNRQAAKDRLEAKHDYAVNLKSEMEILALHSKIDELRDREWQRLMDLQEAQLSRLTALERAVGAPGAQPPERA